MCFTRTVAKHKWPSEGYSSFLELQPEAAAAEDQQILRQRRTDQTETSHDVFLEKSFILLVLALARATSTWKHSRSRFFSIQTPFFIPERNLPALVRFYLAVNARGGLLTVLNSHPLLQRDQCWLPKLLLSSVPSIYIYLI